MSSKPASRAVIYARQSEDVAEGIDRQLQRCRMLAEARGWNVVREYVDNDTSASRRRSSGSGWAEMIDSLSRGSAEVVIAVDVDRLLRTMRDLVAITDTGARVLTVDGEIDLTTADGEFRATMLAGIARFETRRKGERQRRANDDRAARGKPLPGRRRFGYETDGATPRETEAVIVRRMFQHVLSGGSVRSLAANLRAGGIDAGPGNGEWRTGRVRDILANPHYGGAVRHRGEVVESDVIVPLVPREVAAEVRAILADPTRKTTPGPQRRHLLSGLAHCGECGQPLVFRNGYVCTANLAHVFIQKQKLEDPVREAVASAILAGPLDPSSESADVDVHALLESHAKNGARVAEILEERAAGLVPPTIAREALGRLKTEREAIESQLAQSRAEKGAQAALGDIASELLGDRTSWTIAEFMDMKNHVLARFEGLELTRQREIVRALLYVQVQKGRDKDRVRVLHLKAAHLNEDDPDRLREELES